MTLELKFLPLHLDKEGVGAKTSGSGECPFSDVRSLSTAPLVPPKLLRSRCLRGRVPDALHIYTQVRRTCSPAPADAPPAPVPRTAAWGRRARILSGGHALTAPPLLWIASEHTGGNCLAFGDRFCLEPVLRAKPVPSAGRVSLHRRGRFVFTSINKTCRYPVKKIFFPPLGDLNLYPIFLVLPLPGLLFYCRVALPARPILSETRKWPTRACNC